MSEVVDIIQVQTWTTHRSGRDKGRSSSRRRIHLVYSQGGGNQTYPKSSSGRICPLTLSKSSTRGVEDGQVRDIFPTTFFRGKKDRPIQSQSWYETNILRLQTRSEEIRQQSTSEERERSVVGHYDLLHDKWRFSSRTQVSGSNKSMYPKSTSLETGGILGLLWLFRIFEVER